MSAIITQNFRLDTTERFVDSLATESDTYYIGIGKPGSWPLVDDFEVPSTPKENDSSTNQVWQEMIAMTKLLANDISFAAPRHVWEEGPYQAYDDTDDPHDSDVRKTIVITNINFNVYICLHSSGDSINSPDDHAGGIKTDGVMVMDDGYIWKYLFTLTTENANKFLTNNFIPVRKLDSDPALDDNGNSVAAPAALVDQWDVQLNSVNNKGSIYHVAIDNQGGSYDTSTITVDVIGNGTGATAQAIISNGNVTEVVMTSYGIGYDYAEVIVNCSTGSGCKARPIMSPRGGFGSDPRFDMRAHYVLFNKSFIGDGDGIIPSTGEFRQISLIKNPVESEITGDGLVCGNTYYNTCKSINMTGTNLAADGTISSTVNGIYAEGYVVEQMGNNIYYVQNEGTGFGSFVQNGTETGTASNITAVKDSDVQFNSGEVMFLENRASVSRSTDQTETIRLAIEF